ncbi:uncharacterized protein LA080_008566 [Diaporthe eres]|nr:uncharacterized protein LA080_008566 [Diaporthe eres]
MYRQSYQLEVGVWIQSCSLQDKKACCVTDAPSASCCNDTSNLFSFTPGYIQAVINGDGTNRLGPATVAAGGGTTSLSTPIRDAVIAVGAVLGTILLITLASLVFMWRKFSKERRLRREEQGALRRQRKETWPQLTHEATFQAGGGGVAGGRSEMYAGEFKGVPWSRDARELPASQHVGELST